MKYINSILLLLLFTVIKTPCTKAQEIIREDLPFETVPSLAPPNDTLIDPAYFPFGIGRIIEKTSFRIDSSRITEQAQSRVDKYLVENKIKDNGKTGFCYGLVQEKDNRVYIKRLPVKVVYFYNPYGGAYKVRRSVAVYGDYSDKLVEVYILTENYPPY
jgi:hypothetical protein